MSAVASAGVVRTAAEPPHSASVLVRVLVRFADTAGRGAALRKHDGLSRGPVGKTGYEVVELPAASSRVAASALALEPGVLAAEPDARVSILFTPNDPYFVADPFTVGGVGQWGLRKAQVDTAWDIQKASPSMIVATIDTGVDAAHPDLRDALVPAPRFVSAADASCPFDTTNRDDNGHGTHVAGLIGASGNNGAGIAGVAFGVRVMPLKALDCTGGGLLSDISSAITYAADHGARVVSISLGSPEPSDVLASAVNYALSKNVVVVAAAGNCGAESGTSRCPAVNAMDYPAAYPGVLAVGATDANDQPTPFSTAGAYVGISAPGTNILSTFPTYPVQLSASAGVATPYAVFRGTSQAAPLVAGVAALVLSQEPSLAPAAVVQQLRSSADDVGPVGFDVKTGDGRVNALRALTSARTLHYGARYQVVSAPAALAYASTTTLRTVVTNSSSFTWRASGPNPVRVSTHWYAADGSLVVWDGPRANFASDVPPATSLPVDVPLSVPAPKGTYSLQVDLVQEGMTWFSSHGIAPLSLSIVVNGGYGATYAIPPGAVSIATGTVPTLLVTVTNQGTRTWPAAGPTPVRLASHLRQANGALLLWDGPRTPLASEIAPGATATLAAALPMPAATGSYLLELDLVQDGLTWFSAEGVAPRALTLTVTNGYGVRYSFATPPALLPGERMRITGSLANASAFTWTATGANSVRLSSHEYDADATLVSWDGARTDLASDVAPNGTIAASLVVDAPGGPGSYELRVDLVREGISWFSSQGASALRLPLAVIVDRRAQLATKVTSVSRSRPGTLAVTLTNTSLAAFSSEGLRPVLLSSHWLGADGSVLLWDGPRASLGSVLLPGDSATVTLALAAPPTGAAILVVDLVQEGAAWFDMGVRSAVTVTP